MSSDSTVTSVFSKRLKQARLRTDLTQEQLGILAGIDEFSASARVNQYEKGKHAPTVQTSQRLARALLIPTSFLYEEDDLLANLLLIAGRLSKEKKRLSQRQNRSRKNSSSLPSVNSTPTAHFIKALGDEVRTRRQTKKRTGLATRANVSSEHDLFGRACPNHPQDRRFACACCSPRHPSLAIG